MNPNLPVGQLPGIGQYYAHKLRRLEIKTLRDLVYHFPFRYDDFSKIQTIQNVAAGQKLSIQGIIWQIKNIRTKGGKFITRATVADQSGTIEVIWFNQPFLTKNLKAGMPVSLSGKVQADGRRLQLVSPSYEIIRSQTLNERTPNPKKLAFGNNAFAKTKVGNLGIETLHTARLVPVYPETEGVSSKWLRAKIAKVLPAFLKAQKDHLPPEIVRRQKLEGLNFALEKIHFPQTYQEIQEARRRLAFDELFLIQVISALRKKNWQEKRVAPQMKIDKEKTTALTKNLSFKLTSAQRKAIVEILSDMQKSTPANRLLGGDVGSGKTVVAAICAYVAFLNDFDTLVAAPTEILAFQHQKTLANILSPYGLSVGAWTGSKKIKGEITCGTHALLTSFKPQRQVGLVVVDEQHRFGVAQRAKLFLEQAKKLTPHLLTMTATPIPRTLALTLYGDLDLSVLDEMPQGRQKIATFVVPSRKREDAYRFIEKQIRQGQQTFIITPFVEPSETMSSVRAAIEEFEKLKEKFSQNVRLGLLHGKLKSREKEKAITEFKEKKIDILVATPVVEVGIDVPNATIMMIESAERFGLAQLHQLRGRVGRGEHKSYCLLFTDSTSQTSLARLKSMEKVHVGAHLAEIDLKMRGPGEIFGLRQSGYIDLKIADLADQQTISLAQSEAKRIIEKNPSLKKYPVLSQKLKEMQLAYVQPN